MRKVEKKAILETRVPRVSLRYPDGVKDARVFVDLVVVHLQGCTR